MRRPLRALEGVLMLVLLPLTASSLGAQALPWGSFGIDRFGHEHGLPGLYVQNLAVTEDGRLWMRASGVLTSFDGLEFERHHVAEAAADAEGGMGGIAAGRADTLWILKDRELHSLVAGQTRLRAQHTERLRNVRQDRDGNLWVLNSQGILRLGTSGFEPVVRFRGASDEAVVPVDSAAAYGREPDLAIVDAGWGSPHRTRDARVVSPRPFPDAWPIPRDGAGHLVVRTGPDSVEVVDADGARVSIMTRSRARVPLLVDRRGLFWTASPGRVEALGVEGDVLVSLETAPGAWVASIVEDAEGNVWVGTVRDGLYRISVRPVRVLGEAEGVTDDQVLRVWGTPDGGVVVVDNRRYRYRLTDNQVDTIFEPGQEEDHGTRTVVDRRGTQWRMSANDSGAWLSGRTPEGREIRIARPRTAYTRIAVDPVVDGLLWLVGQGGAYKVSPYLVPTEPDGLPLAPGWTTRDIVVDEERGVVWAAGNLGVARLSHDRVRHFLAEDGFPTGNARALHLDEDGTLWVATYQRGLVRYHDGVFGVVRMADGLWDDGASSVLEDDAGNLWLGSNRGVYRVAREDLNAFLDGHSDRLRSRGYDTSDGLRNPEASGWPAHRSPDGRMWFPTFSGVAVIDPEAVIASEAFAPRIRMRGIEAEESVFAASASVSLGRGQRRIGLTYGATLLSGHEGLWYEVLLEGVDPNWVDVGDQRSVTYGAVPPGRRTFRVRAAREAGVAGNFEASITLDVPPYFRETWPFYLVLTMVAASTLAGAYHVRIRQLRAREATLRQMVQERTTDLRRSQARTEDALATVEAQAAELRSLDEAKSRFFANVSHELRTPLTLVQGPLIDVLDGRLGPTSDAVKEQVEIVLGSGRRLGELVEQLLDVARLESGELRLSVARQDLKPLFEQLAASFGALARSLNIGFDVELPDGSVWAHVDADRIEKVYGNLLANALKFTSEGGRVGFVVEVVGEDLVATVEDDGPGIPEDERERVFERFHQVDSSSRRAHGGTGLGLALVKEITELHGGRVELGAPAGGGSRFTVSIPVGGPPEWAAEHGAQDTAARDQVARSAKPRILAAPTRSPETLTKTDGDASRLGSVPETGGDATGLTSIMADGGAGLSDDTQRPTVLVVEDNPELRAYLRRHLEDDCRVVEASNGVEGLEQARRAVPDLILCDIMMPVMDGEELCRAIRADPELDFLPVVMVTARTSRESRLSALEGGADDYLVKPFDPEELRLRVGNLLAARRRLRERLLEEGKSLPAAALDLPVTKGEEDVAQQIVTVLWEKMDDEDLEPEAIAKALLMSRATLYRKSEEALGASPMELLWSLRLQQAAQWLRETDATVSEVAYACGFKTVPHFTRRFKQRFESTPASYRSEHRAGQ